MRVLVACEFSGVVREAFAARGHDVTSCDLLPTEAPCSPNSRHIQGDVLEILNQDWDLMIAHPPCTYISNMSNCRIHEPGRLELRSAGLDFFMKIASSDIGKVAIENPRGLPERAWRKADQIIQPYHFGHPQSKATCLWLNGLPKLQHTEIVDYERKWDGKRWRTWVDSYGSHNSHHRSVTFMGIARAMAEQWG